MLPRRVAPRPQPEPSAAAEPAHYVAGSLAGGALLPVAPAGSVAFGTALAAALGRRGVVAAWLRLLHHSTPSRISRITVMIAETSSEPKQPSRLEKNRNMENPVYPTLPGVSVRGRGGPRTRGRA